MVAYVTGRILTLGGLLMSLSLFFAFYYHEPVKIKLAILISVCIALAIGLLASFKRPTNFRFYVREGMVITALSWVLLAVIGALPFYLSDAIPSFVDSFFESASGMTTTGSSILNNVEVLPKSLLFWRSFTHFIGGMGVLVFALAVLPNGIGEGVHVMRAEMTGPSFGKLVSRLTITARILYTIYAGLTAVLFFCLMFSGMGPFDAIIHAMGTAGTGGFSNYNTSVGYFHSTLIDYIISIGMFMFGVNFYLYYFALRGDVKELLRNEELRFYLLIVLSSICLITLNIYSQYEHFLDCVRDVVFTVISIITTTGFAISDFDQWPQFSKSILIGLMFIGGCAGSTAGGLKVGRFSSILRMGRAQVLRSTNPNRVTVVLRDGKVIHDKAQNEIAKYLILYILLFVAIFFLVSLDNIDYTTCFTAVAGTFNNIGPGLNAVGPTKNFSELSDLSKIVLSFGMIAGRLELFPILILLSPSTWRLK